jgi:hypothetical protein
VPEVGKPELGTLVLVFKLKITTSMFLDSWLPLVQFGTGLELRSPNLWLFARLAGQHKLTRELKFSTPTLQQPNSDFIQASSGAK